MKTIYCKFEIEANKTEIVGIEVMDDATDAQIQNEIEHEYDLWADNNTTCNIERV